MSAASMSHDRVFTGEAWRDFCARLAEAGDIILRPDAPATPLDRAEGFRHLTHILQVGLMQNLEAADPDFPFFYRPCDEHIKYGGDNPDNVYWSATVKGDRDYRITGTRGTMHYFSIGSKAFNPAGSSDPTKSNNIISTGELNSADMRVDPDGKFEITVSAAKHGDNWLPMQPDTNFLLIRQTYADRKAEQPGTFHIERIGGPKAPAPLDPKFLEAALMRTAAFVTGNAKKFSDWNALYTPNINQMPKMDQELYWKAGGDPLLNYCYGYFRLAPDEAWVITVTPPECIYWSYTLYNVWNQSFDYQHRPVNLNNHGAKYNADGSVTLVVSERDVGMGNWLDTAGHREGLALFRWLGAKTHPQPECRVVKLDELRTI